MGLYAESEATPLVGIWWRENRNKLIEWKALVDSVGIKGVDLEDKIFVLVFYGFPNCLDVRKGRKLPYAVYIIFQLHVTFAVCSAGEI